MCLYSRNFPCKWKPVAFLHFMLRSATERRTKVGHQLILPSVSLAHDTGRAGATSELDKTQLKQTGMKNKQAGLREQWLCGSGGALKRML